MLNTNMQDFELMLNDILFQRNLSFHFETYYTEKSFLTQKKWFLFIYLITFTILL